MTAVTERTTPQHSSNQTHVSAAEAVMSKVSAGQVLSLQRYSVQSIPERSIHMQHA